LTFEADKTVAVAFRRPGRCDDSVHEGGVADRPLERLFGAHREANDRAEVIQMQRLCEKAMDRVDVIPNRHDREPRPMKRVWRVARRGRSPVAEELGQHDKVTRRIQRAVNCACATRGVGAICLADEPVVAVEVGHVVGRQ